MLRAKITQKNFLKNKRPFKIKPSNNTKQVATEELDKELKTFIEDTKNIDIQNKYNMFEDLINSNKILKPIQDENQSKWLTKETKELLKTRAELLLVTGKTRETRRRISEISKKIKLNMRKDRQRYRLELLERCIQKTGGIKKAKKHLIEKTDWIPNLTDKNKKQKTRRPEILSLATEFFRDLYSKGNISDPSNVTGGEEVPEILPAEVEKAIKTQKKDKAPGSDGIKNEFLIQNIEHLTPILTDLFNNIIRSETIPEQWSTSTIILLHKKGDKNNINNYRPISLMSNIYKVFAKILLNRITQTLDENQPREQAGFRSGYSTIDHIYVVKQLFEKGREFNITFYCCFVDYSKAFDSLDHEKIWQALKNQGVEHKYIRILKQIYVNSKAKIKLEREGKEIRIERGVRQGDPLSPKLFTAVLEEIFKQLDWETCGIRINGENLSHLRFADDLFIISQSREELQDMLRDLDRESRKIGLNMNTEKTKAMTNGQQGPICVNNNKIGYVDEYIYLGQTISPVDLTSKEIDRRIGNAWKQYWSLKEVMKNPETSISIKRKLFDTCVLPVLTYGCQTWALNKTHVKKLEVCQNAMERSMLGKRLSDRIRTTNIKRCTRTKNVTVSIRKLKWKWAGHTIRDDIKWSGTVMRWFTGHYRRKRGRPPRRWVDDIKATLGGGWPILANNRKAWRKLGEAFAKKGQTDETKTMEQQHNTNGNAKI